MSQETTRMRGMLMQYSSRVATTERLYTFYIMNMLPPENVQLTDEVQQWLSVLPAYDSNVSADVDLIILCVTENLLSNSSTWNFRH